ncbi:MAG: cache domain-containing protein [Bacteroidota bacterium]
MKLRRQSINLRERIILNFVLVGVVSVFVVSFYTYNQTRKAILNRTFEQLTSVRVVKKRQIEAFFNDRIRDINLLSKSEELLNILQPDKSDSLVLPKLNYKSYISNYIYSCGYYDGLIIANNDGIIIQRKSVNNDSVLSISFIDKKSKEYLMIFNSIKSSSAKIIDFESKDKLQLKVASPIRKNNKLIGYIALEIPLVAINTIMVESGKESGFGESGESYLVGEDRLMRSDSRFHKNSVLSSLVKTLSVENAYLNKEGTEIIFDYRNIEVLSSYSKLKIPGLNWAILAEYDFEEIMIPIIKTRNEIILMSVIISFLIFTIAYLIARHITSPILKLKNAAIEIGKGNYPILKINSSNDEITELTNSFNIMSSQIKENQIQLQEEKQKRLSAAIDGQEQERQRLSRELHDGIGQSLVALKFKIESIFDKNSSNQEPLNQINTELSVILEDVRRLSYNLMPAALSEFGLIMALKNMAKQLSEISKIYITFEASENLNITNKRINVYLFRIAQEALNNSIKYAQASAISIDIFDATENYIMMIEDNGCGFEYSTKSLSIGNGIYNMKERAMLLGGSFEIESKKNKGTTVHVRIPKLVSGE